MQITKFCNISIFFSILTAPSTLSPCCMAHDEVQDFLGRQLWFTLLSNVIEVIISIMSRFSRHDVQLTPLAKGQVSSRSLASLRIEAPFHPNRRPEKATEKHSFLRSLYGSFENGCTDSKTSSRSRQPTWPLPRRSTSPLYTHPSFSLNRPPSNSARIPKTLPHLRIRHAPRNNRRIHSTGRVGVHRNYSTDQPNIKDQNEEQLRTNVSGSSSGVNARCRDTDAAAVTIRWGWVVAGDKFAGAGLFGPEVDGALGGGESGERR